MLPAVTLLSGIIQLAPSLVSLFKGSEKQAEVAELAAHVARTVTGTNTNEDALAALKANPDFLIEYKRSIREHEKDLEALYIQDKASARERDAEFIRRGTSNYRANSLVAISFVIVLIILYVVVTSQDINEFAKGVLTTILGMCINQLNNVFNFEFGSTRKSEAANEKLVDDYISIPADPSAYRKG